MHAVEGDFEDDLRAHLAHRAPAPHGVVAHPLVEAAQFLVGKAGIGLADRHQLVAAPGAEGVVGIERRALAVAALGIHQDGVEGQRAAFPFEPRALRPAGDVERIRPLQHQPLDAALAGPVAQFPELLPAGERHHRRQIESRARLPRVPRFEPAPAFGKGQAAQIFRPLAQHVVEPHCGRKIAQQFRGRGLAVEPLLQIVEGGDLAVADHQQLAVECHIGGHRRADVRESAAPISSPERE